jgi:YVTN family beta-propeller protein
MRIRRTVALATLATSLVACEDVELDTPKDGPDPKPGQVQTDGGAGPITAPTNPDAGVYTGPVLKKPSRGAALALSADDSVVAVVNRDVGTLSVLKVKYGEGKNTVTEPSCEVQLGVGSEPWQVVIGPDDDSAFVVLRKEQKLVRVKNLKGEAVVDGTVQVGSEPTSLALSPTGRTAYVSSWANGEVSVVDTTSMSVTGTVDLNGALAKTGYLGSVKGRPALAHPRSITVTNDLDSDDADETLLVNEFFSQQIAELSPDGLNADVNRAGIVYAIKVASGEVRTIDLAPLQDIGFKDSAGNSAGCFPNQLQSITINAGYAYVVSVCAAPEGPEGLKVTTTACTTVDDCKSLNLVDPVCDVVAFGKTPVCQDVASFKTATSPVISVIDLAANKEVPDSARNLNKAFADFFAKSGVAQAAQRFPLFANDLEFVPGTGVGYVTGNGIDAAFRVVFDATSGKLAEVGASTAPFLNLNPAGIKAGFGGKGPIGIAIGAAEKKLAFVANDITRNLSALDFNTQGVLGGVDAPSVTATTGQPAKGSEEEHILLGKDLFNTGRARWSLFGQGWGACQSCHQDGLTDNVTWYFGRGPRQSVPLDGSFASKNGNDARLLNYTTNRDEVADFDANTKGTSGGVGAIVLAKSSPPVNVDRIDTAGLKLAELDGSSLDASDPSNPLQLGFDAEGKIVVGQLIKDATSKSAASQLDDWINITKYVKSLRSPRAPNNLDKAKVAAGADVFAHEGSCQGCHGGDKWTVSKLFYKPGVAVNAALKTTNFVVPPGFPTNLLPATDVRDQKLVLNAGGESVQCVERNVQTFNKAEPGVGIAEVRGNNMKDLAQGGGVALRANEDGDNDPSNDVKAGIGYNVPSLLGTNTGAPFLHAGNARTLEALFSKEFEAHSRALAPNLFTQTNASELEGKRDALIQYLLSIDEDSTVVELPKVAGAQGGSLCPDNFTGP